MSEQRYTAQEMREESEGILKAKNDAFGPTQTVFCETDFHTIEANGRRCRRYFPDIKKTKRISEMLRQSADAEEENAKLREENAKLTSIINVECNKCGDCAKFGNDCTAGDVDGNEDCRACEKFVPKDVAQLRARLEAVVKIMKQREQWFSCRTCAQDILRAARGEGGAE